MIVLDDLVARRNLARIRLLKIDVEGYEAEVLAGAAATLALTDHVIFEWLPEGDEAAGRRVVEALESQGFVLRQVDGSPWTAGGPAIEHNVWAARPE